MTYSKEELKVWAVQFMKHRDLMQHTLQKIEENKEGYDFIATHTTKKEYGIVQCFIDDFDTFYSLLKKDQHMCIFLYNNQETVLEIIKHWKQLTDLDKLTFYFVNPHASGDTRWILRPYIHARIADDASIKTGLLSMFSMVEPVYR